MKKFTITAREIRRVTVEVTAETRDEALDEVSSLIRSGNVEFDSTSIEFEYLSPSATTEPHLNADVGKHEDRALLNAPFCRKSIDGFISESFDGYHLNTDWLKEVCDLFGRDTVELVLKETIEWSDDGRYSPSNRAWAKTVLADYPQLGEIKRAHILKSHPAVINGLVDEFRKNY